MLQALTEKGFFEDKSPHKLIICGDLFDRGSESVKMQNFICELLKNDDVILVRGNHEDLILDLIRDAKQLFGYGIEHTHHWSNGTVKTVADLTGTDVFTDDYRKIFVITINNTVVVVIFSNVTLQNFFIASITMK